MRLRAQHYFSFLAAAVLMAVPVWAHTDSVHVQVDHTVTIAGTQLNPGDYDLRVQESGTQVSVLKDGNVIAQVPCTWIQLSKKSEYSQVQFSENEITEVDFQGKTEAIQFK